MALTLSYDTHTEIGLVRSNNQDSAYVSPRMLMVADGMGGAAAGDLASAVAARELAKADADLDARVRTAREERLASGEELPADDPDHPGELVDVLTVMAGTLARANERLVELVEDDPELAGMGTTVCGYVLSHDRLAVVNIGDSRAYLVRDGRLHRVTRDHSWVQSLVDDGRITEEEALEHPHRSLVLRVLSGSNEYEPDLGWLDVRAGDRLLVCSDGLCGLVTDAAIAEVTTSGGPRAEVVERLVGLAHEAGGHDNITIVLADVEEDGPPGPVGLIGAAASVVEPAAREHTTALPVGDVASLHPDELHERAITEQERYALSGRRRPSGWLKLGLAVLLPLVLLVGGGTTWFQYTQTRHFIGPNDAKVALFQGVPGTLLGRPLSTLLVEDDTRIADLPPYYAERVRGTIPVASVEGGRLTLDELKAKARQCIAQRERRAQMTAAPSPSPSATTPLPDPYTTPTTSTASPGLTGSATPLPSETATPQPVPTPVTAPEDC